MSESNLEQIIYECRKESRKAQQVLYKSFYGFAMGICLRYSNNRYEAAEILNKGFLKVFESLHSYNHQDQFKSWLKKIIINASIEYHRSDIQTPQFECFNNIETTSKGIDDDREFNYNDLLALVQQLPSAYRMVFNLYAIDGYSHEEISKMLKIDIAATKCNLFKARIKLIKGIDSS